TAAPGTPAPIDSSTDPIPSGVPFLPRTPRRCRNGETRRVLLGLRPKRPRPRGGARLGRPHPLDPRRPGGRSLPGLRGSLYRRDVSDVPGAYGGGGGVDVAGAGVESGAGVEIGPAVGDGDVRHEVAVRRQWTAPASARSSPVPSVFGSASSCPHVTHKTRKPRDPSSPSRRRFGAGNGRAAWQSADVSPARSAPPSRPLAPGPASSRRPRGRGLSGQAW